MSIATKFLSLINNCNKSSSDRIRCSQFLFKIVLIFRISNGNFDICPKIYLKTKDLADDFAFL